MGKGIIISGGAAGLYRLVLGYGVAARDARVAQITAELAALVATLAAAQQALDFAQWAEDAKQQAAAAAIDAYVAAAAAVAPALQAVMDGAAVLAAVQADDFATPEELASAQAALSGANSAYAGAQKARADALDAYTKAASALMQAMAETAKLRRPLDMLKAKQAQLTKDRAAWAALVLTETVDAWCADLTQDASGQVATIEIPGENAQVLIAPAAPAPAATDGLLTARQVQSPGQVFWNAAVLPGWQKYKPTYRRGAISAINEGADTADVLLDVADKSSAQNLVINQTPTLSNVPVKYMDCNALAFEVGDRCVVKFLAQSWETPQIVGFVDNPKTCSAPLSGIVREGSLVILPVPAGSPAGTVGKTALHSYKPTAQAWQYPLRSDPAKSPEAFHDEPRLGKAAGQYASLSASMFSGRMAPAVQVIMARGTSVAYGYSWALCHGIVIAQDGNAWLLELSATNGALAMRLPVDPAHAASPEAVIAQCATLFDGVPSGKAFPTGADLSAKMSDGLVIRLATAADLQPFYNKNAFAAHLGWAFKGDGTEAHNTCWRSGTGAEVFGCLYRLDISISAQNPSWVKGQPLATGAATLSLAQEGRLVHAGLYFFRLGFVLPGGSIAAPPAEQPATLPTVAYQAPVHVCYVDDALDVVYYAYAPQVNVSTGPVEPPAGGAGQSTEQWAQCYAGSTRFATHPRQTDVTFSASYSLISICYGAREVIENLSFTSAFSSVTSGGASCAVPFGARDSYVLFNDRESATNFTNSGVTHYSYDIFPPVEPSGSLVPLSENPLYIPLAGVPEYVQIIGHRGVLARIDAPADPGQAYPMTLAWTNLPGPAAGAGGGMVVRYSVMGNDAHAAYTAALWGDDYALLGPLLAAQATPNPVMYNFLGYL